MADKKDLETGKNDLKHSNPICRGCDSKLVIASGRYYNGEQGFDISCPKCRFTIFTTPK